MRSAYLFTMFLGVCSLVACGGGGGSGSSGQGPMAPASLAGQTYESTISSGSTPLAQRGTYRVSFTASTYSVQGDGVNTSNSAGTYSSYRANGAVGTADLLDNRTGAITSTLTFTSASAGTFDLRTPGTAFQTGTFVKL